MGAQETVPFHLLVSGECWLKIEGRRAVRLLQGDISAVVRGQPHRLLRSPSADSIPYTKLLGNQATGDCPRIRHGGRGAATLRYLTRWRMMRPAHRQARIVVGSRLRMGIHWLDSDMAIPCDRHVRSSRGWTSWSKQARSVAGREGESSLSPA